MMKNNILCIIYKTLTIVIPAVPGAVLSRTVTTVFDGICVGGGEKILTHTLTLPSSSLTL